MCASLPSVHGILKLSASSLVVAMGAAAFLWAPQPAPARDASTNVCSRFAGPGGRDAGPGTITDPYRTVGHLVRRLRAGETGCLRGSVYREDVDITRGGVPGRPLTLRSVPGHRATIQGRLAIAGSADDVVVSFLRLDGSTTNGEPSPQVNGDRVVFRSNDVSNRHTAICFILGGAFAKYGRAVGTVIDRNRIHDCGRLPATNHDHGVYIEAARYTRVTNNVIYGNADWGVHLYPDADNTRVANNVIVGNGGGVIIAGEAGGDGYSVGYASDTNVIEWNVIANSTLYHNVDTYWGGPTGRGNLAQRNCLWNGKGGNFGDIVGLAVRGNVVANPLFVNPERGNFELQARSRCLRLGAGPAR